ncbi:hypothetical protein MRB53_016198 [Persea americana]|uniref:Uncharacterized protein n=1 Tax=Persea americana TaxID=3435 RepID=A0ACC2M1C8_PERAE|nr:hypothetical protein MRB53_016198 [Persea americana]
MKCVVTIRVALKSLLLVIGSFSSILGFYPLNPEPRNPSHPVDEIQKIIEGMIGIEASERWVELINRIGTANLPPSATIFFQTGKDVSLGSKQWAMDPQVIRYHNVPRAISY